MNEFEERLLALLENAEQQAQTNKEQSDENKELLQTIRELVAHVETVKPQLDKAIRINAETTTDDYREMQKQIVANAVYQATSQSIDEEMLGAVEKQVASKFAGIEAKFDGIADNVEPSTNRLIQTLNQATDTANKTSESLDNFIQKKGLWIGAIAGAVTVICVILVLFVHWLIKPDPKEVGELRAEIQRLSELKMKNEAELSAQKRRYDQALSHANTQYVNNELYIQVDKGNCADGKGDIRYCRLVGVMPTSRSLYNNMPAPQF